MKEYLASAVHFLQAEQQSNGSFMGYASPNANLSEPLKAQPTIFPTLLMLNSLAHVPGTEKLRDSMTAYVQSQMTSQGSWNYWDNNSKARASEPYPDDLDDTACALASLTNFDAQLVTGNQLGQFARLLVASEQQPGGPYNTWLADTNQTPQWTDIDIAVNANIGYTLSLHDVHLVALDTFVSECITNGLLQSKYYVGEVPVLYFLARWYRGSAYQQLRQRIADACLTVDSPVQTALLLSAAHHVELPNSQQEPLIERLLQTQTNGHWPGAGMYIDPIYDGQQHYGGSAALTTALALEALQHYHRPNHRVLNTELPELPKELAGITNNDIRQQYEKLSLGLAASPAGKQITAPADLLVLPESKLSVDARRHLNWGSLHGWVAYTLQDRVLDGDNNLLQLTTANTALRRSLQHYAQVLPTQLIQQTFDTMDCANAWELQHARLPTEKVTDYADYQQLAERSWGHSLAAYGVMLHNLPDIEHPAYEALQQYYRHFLIARQLNDDAHDWEDDLENGQLTAVVSLLPYDRPVAELRQLFWEQTIVEVAERIMEHLALARQEIEGLEAYLNGATLHGWLDELTGATQTALDGRQQTIEFMQAYDPELAV